MFKAVAFLKKKPGISRQDFIEYYESTHVKLIRELLPMLVGYRRLYPVHGHALNYNGQFDQPEFVNGDVEEMSVQDFDVITEITFEDEAGCKAFFAALNDPAIRERVAADELNFLDRDGNRLLVIEEYKSDLKYT